MLNTLLIVSSSLNLADLPRILRNIILAACGLQAPMSIRDYMLR